MNPPSEEKPAADAQAQADSAAPAAQAAEAAAPAPAAKEAAAAAPAAPEAPAPAAKEAEAPAAAAPVAAQDEAAAVPTEELFKPVIAPHAASAREVRKARRDIEQAPPKQGIIERFARHGKDVGSSEIQIALLTGRILHLTEHLKVHTKDKHGNHGLLKLVSERKKLLDYLSRSNPDNFRKLKKELNLR